MDSTLTATSVTILKKYIQELESLYRQEHRSTFQPQEKYAVFPLRYKMDQ